MVYAYPKMFGSTRLILVKSTGETVSYFVEIGQSKFKQKDGLSDGKMLSGTFMMSSHQTGVKKFSDSYQSYLNTKLWLTENLYFKSTFLGDQDKSELIYAELNYFNYFLKWHYFADERIGVKNYIYNAVRGYEAGYEKGTDTFSAWTGTDIATKEKQFSGLILRKNFSNRYTLAYGQNFYEDRSIPLFYAGYFYNGLTLGMSYSFLEQQQLINPRLSYSFGENFLNLTQITLDYSAAPNGSYGLTANDSISKSNTEVGAYFANKKVDENDNPEYIPGYVFSSIVYNYSTRDIFDSHDLRYRLLYGMNDKITANGYLGYEQSNSLLTYDKYYINPSLNIYVKGDKRHGLYLKTSYENSYFKTSTDVDWNQTQKSLLGLYYNRYNFFVGGDIGSEISDLRGVQTTSNILGISSGISKDKIVYSGSFYRAFNDAAFSNTIAGNISYRPRSDLYLRGKIAYKSQENTASGLSSNDTNIYVGLTYLFGVGDSPVNKAIYEKVSSLEGTVYLDKNLNGIRDENEPVVSGAKVSVTKQGDMDTVTDSNGEFKFSNFSKDVSYVVNVEKEGYASSKTGSVKMTDYSQKVDIGLFEFTTKKIYVTGPVKMVDVSLRTSCEGTSYEPRSEMLSDYFEVTLPKGLNCDTVVDLSKLDEPYIVNIQKETPKSTYFNVQKASKFVTFTLEGKRNKASIDFNKTKYDIVKGSELSVIIEEFKGRRKFSVPKGCEISPKISDFNFSEIKNNFFYKIMCF